MKKIFALLFAVPISLTSFTGTAATISGGSAGGSYAGGFGIIGEEPVNMDWIIVSDWAWEYVDDHFNNNLMPFDFYQISDFTADITRLQLCELIEPTLANKGYILQESITQQFDDCDNSSVSLLAHFGIVTGVSDKTFEPDRNISREEAAAILYRLCEFTDITDIENQAESFLYADNNDISEWAKTAVYSLYDLGIMTGMGDNCFSPDESYTIEQAVKTVSEIYDIMPENSNTYPSAESGGTMLQGDMEHVINSWYDEYYEIQYNDTVYISSSECMEDAMLTFSAYECSGMVSGKIDDIVYIAVNKSDNTAELFKMPDAEKQCTIPYTVRMIHNGNIITVNEISSQNAPKEAFFGVYSIDGKEIHSTSYTWNEIKEKGYYTAQSSGGGSGSGMSSASLSDTEQNDGKILVFDENYPTYGILLVGCNTYEKDGIIYVPVLDFADSMGFEIISESSDNSISVSAYGNDVSFEISDSSIIINNELYISAQELAEAFGYSFEYDTQKNILTFKR